MGKFSFSDCEISWNARAEVSAEDKTAIKSDLARLSELFYEALGLTKTWALEKNREVSIQIWLDTGESERDYYVDVFYDEGFEGWVATIEDAESHSVVGDVICEKWGVAGIVSPEEDVES